MAGTSDDELLYEDRSFRIAGIRLPWLLVNLCGLLGTGWLLEYYQSQYKEALYLLFFVPVIMGMGGNSGSQTSMITVRGLATGRIVPERRPLWVYLFRQIKVGVLLGLLVGIVVFGIAYFKERDLLYATVVSLALLFALVLAATAGAIVPVLFQKLGIDPAVASGPLVSTTSDLLGIFVYFTLAGLMIRYLLS
jgi:magnesium transporter